MSFVERHGLWTERQREAAAEMLNRIEADGLEMVRLSFPDLHGVLRGKVLVADAVPSALRDGLAITSTLLLKDTSHRTVVPVFSPGAGIGVAEMQGGGDVIMVPDPTTFRRLPWSDKSGWVLCDLYFRDGRKVPFATRHVGQAAVDRLASAGYDFVAGLEVEFHLTRLVDPRLGLADSGQPGTPPEVALLHQGHNYLTEQRFDQIEPIVDILRRDVMALGLGLRSVELEFGPSQCEFVFRPEHGMRSADDMVLFRSAAKQISRRHGYHASFMCRPALPNVMSSGWHLHQSLARFGAGGNAFMPEPGEKWLSAVGMNWLGGLLAAAPAAAAFTTPTINGYKRYRANSLAPDRAAWARDNRGALLRVLGGPGDPASRIENRAGEPAANPYLYLASQIVSGLAGLEGQADPGPAADAPYEIPAPPLPGTLEAALALLAPDSGSAAGALLRAGFGEVFVDYYRLIKSAEVARYNQAVTDWEHREYFDLF
jgi:glutamine synthetase